MATVTTTRSPRYRTVTKTVRLGDQIDTVTLGLTAYEAAKLLRNLRRFHNGQGHYYDGPVMSKLAEGLDLPPRGF